MAALKFRNPANPTQWLYVPTAGPQGPAGADGTGSGGTTILNGAGPPLAATGAVGNYYADTFNDILYGPKAAAGAVPGAVLSEPFDSLANWSGSGGNIIPGGRNGNGFQVTGQGGLSRSYTIPTASKSDYITIGFALYASSIANYIHAFGLYSDAGVNRKISLRIAADGGILVYNEADSIMGSSASGLIVASTWYYIELQVYVTTTSAGYIVVNVNGVNRINTTGVPTKTTGATPIDTVGIQGTGWFSSATTTWDDMYVKTGNGATFAGDSVVGAGELWPVTVAVPAGGGGSTMLTGAGVPVNGTGAVGDYYIDTAGDDIYGPKLPPPPGDERISIAGAPNAGRLGEYSHGVRVTFTAAGFITKLRYQRRSTDGTLTFRAFSSTGVILVPPTAEAPAGIGQTGTYEITLAKPLAVTAGQTVTFSVGSPGAVPWNSTVQGAVTNTAHSTFVGYYVGTYPPAFPDSGQTGITVFIEPTFGEPLAQWPLALETTKTLSGTGVPTDLIGVPGDYYVDTANGVLYGPKIDTGGGVSGEQILTIAGPGPNDFWNNNEEGVRVLFHVAGSVRKVTYRRRSTDSNPLTIRVWNDVNGALLSSVVDAQSTTGTFTVNLPTPIEVTPDSRLVFSLGAAVVPSYAAIGSVTSPTGMTFIDFRKSDAAGTFPNVYPPSNRTYYIWPTLEASLIPSWPVTVRTLPGFTPTVVKATQPTAADYGLTTIPTGAIWVDT